MLYRQQHIAIRAAAALLLSSAYLKLADPGPAATWLQSIGLTSGVSHSFVVFAAVAEAATGGPLLVYPRLGRWRQLAFAIFALILVTRFAMWSLGASGSCGCFGSLVLPDGWILAFVLFGLWATRSRGDSVGPELTPAPKPERLRAAIVLACLFSLPCIGMAATRAGTATRASAQWRIALQKSSECRFLLLGSVHCAHCEDVLRSLRPSAARNVCFVVRDSELAEASRSSLWSSVRVAGIASENWWAALDSAPPAVFERGQDETLRRITLEELRRQLARD